MAAASSLAALAGWTLLGPWALRLWVPDLNLEPSAVAGGSAWGPPAPFGVARDVSRALDRKSVWVGNIHPDTSVIHDFVSNFLCNT